MTTDDPRFGSELAHHWTLDPTVVFLNHGSFGACPRVVLEAQQQWRAQLEREPVRFFLREVEPLLDAARTALAALLDGDPEDLAFVSNATAGVNTVLHSLRFKPGDELLTTDHEYNACRNALEFAAARDGARVVVARVPFPLASPAQVVDAIVAAVTPATRFALIDHITSPTGLVFPIARIVAELSRRGIDTLVDAAHAPGMVPVSLRSIGAAYYTGNLHKWLCTPKGCAFLAVRSDRRESIRPLVISHGANSPRSDRSRFRLEFDWTGTSDPSPFLCIPDAIAFLTALHPHGIAGHVERNHTLALAARRILCDALGVAAPAPDEMIGALAAVPLPDGANARTRSPFYLDALQDALFARGIEVPVVPWPAPPKRLIRVSAQAYNRVSQYQYLAAELRSALAADHP